MITFKKFIKEMAIKKAEDQPYKRPEIDLRGPDGNAFALMAYAKKYAKQLGFENDEIDRILNSMKSSDYENLIKVFDEYFGDYVDLIR
jgi:hypothetical protein